MPDPGAPGSPLAALPAATIFGNSQMLTKSNLAASAAPTVDDDSAAGYAVGSSWFDVTNGTIYFCIDASVGAAVWLQLTPAAALGALAVLSSVGSAQITDGNVTLAKFADLAANTVIGSLAGGVPAALTQTTTPTANALVRWDTNKEIAAARYMGENGGRMKLHWFNVNDDASSSFNASGLNGRGMYLLLSNSNAFVDLLFHVNGATITSRTTAGTNIEIGSGSNPDTDGKLNLWSVAGSPTVINFKNRLGATNVILFMEFSA